MGLVDDIPERPGELTPPSIQVTARTLGAGAGKASNSLARDKIESATGHTEGAPLSLTAVEFVIEKANKDKLYFATLEPEAPLGVDPNNKNTYLFSYRELVRRNILKANKEMRGYSTVPEVDLDMQKLESHLADSDFIAVFGKNKEEFARLAGWKQKNEKRRSSYSKYITPLDRDFFEFI